MATPAHNPATYRPIAFAALGWPGTLEAAMQDTARRYTLRSANPYPDHSAPGQLFAKCFGLEQKRLSAQAIQAQAAIQTIAKELESEHE